MSPTSHQTSGGKGPGEVIIPLSEAKRIEQDRHGRILGLAGIGGDPAAGRRARGGDTTDGRPARR